jgi:hypothetical protein
MALITGNAGNNSLSGTANADRIRGLDGNDRLDGRAGNDALAGGNGRDTLYGGSGRDILIGGLGRDILIGGLGGDVMCGGAGADVFRFDDMDSNRASVGRADVIRDFSSDDTLDLLAVDVLHFDGYNEVPSAEGFTVWQDGGNTYVTWNTFNGIHRVELTGYDGNPGAAASQIRWYEDDYQANANTTGRIAVGQTRTGRIEIRDDEDWFRITIEQGQKYTFDISGDDPGLPPGLILLGEDGNEIVAITPDSRLDFAGDSGTYYVSVYDSRTGSYRLRVTARDYVDDYAGDLSTAGRISVGQTRTGNLAVAFDDDWFCVKLTEGRTYMIDLQGQLSDSGTLFDPYLTLFDKTGSYVADDDDGGHDLDARLVYTATATGTYFISAQSATSHRTGTYQLSVTDSDDLFLLP